MTVAAHFGTKQVSIVRPMMVTNALKDVSASQSSVTVQTTVVHLGINGLLTDDRNVTQASTDIENLLSALQTKHPNSRVAYSEILRIGNAVADASIDACNRQIAQFCQSSPDFVYICHPVLQ